MSNPSEHTFTKGGYQRAPTFDRIIEWVISAWGSIPMDIIVNSFRNAAITVALDGSEDGDISCLKPGKPTHNAYHKLEEMKKVHEDVVSQGDISEEEEGVDEDPKSDDELDY